MLASSLRWTLPYISLWHIQRGPGTVKTVPYSLFYIAMQTYKWSVGRDTLIPPRRSLADCVKPCEFVQILFTICLRIAGRNCVKFIRITKNEWSALYSVDKCVPKGYCNSNSSAKCNEQEMTYPYHRLQKAVVCEIRQQGMNEPSPASCFGERLYYCIPSSRNRYPSLTGHAI